MVTSSNLSRISQIRQHTTSPSELKNIDRVIKHEKDSRQVLPDIVKISLADISSLDRMSEKNKRSYVERFGNIMLKNQIK
jgi:hypothetical protein